jgi:Icc-related predicted phosphoesterase
VSVTFGEERRDVLTLGELKPEPLFHLSYRHARKGGGEAVEGVLPVFTLSTAGLPAELDGIILAADLQGRELLPPTRRNASSPARNFREGRRLLGEVAAERIAGLSAADRLPPPDRLGMVLAGDLWAEPGSIRRGRSGDIRPVWQAFRACGRWVVGVRGNHDVFLERLTDAGDGLHMLDGTTVTLDGLRFGGVGGVIGNPSNPRTRTEERFTGLVRELTASGLNLLVLHHGPEGNGEFARGNRAVREAVEGFGGIVVFGHCYWRDPIQHPSFGPWLVNVDSRVVVLLRDGWQPQTELPNKGAADVTMNVKPPST